MWVTSLTLLQADTLPAPSHLVPYIETWGTGKEGGKNWSKCFCQLIKVPGFRMSGFPLNMVLLRTGSAPYKLNRSSLQHRPPKYTLHFPSQLEWVITFIDVWQLKSTNKSSLFFRTEACIETINCNLGWLEWTHFHLHVISLNQYPSCLAALVRTGDPSMSAPSVHLALALCVLLLS